MGKNNMQRFSDRDDAHRVQFILWDEFIHSINILSQRIQEDGLPDIIIGLQRGGLIPAVCLSHQLGVRLFFSLPIGRTTSDDIFAEKTVPSIIGPQPDLLSEHITGKDVLLVDDIAGTGESIKDVLNLLTSFTPVRMRTCVCAVNRQHWDPHNVHAPTDVLTYVGKEVWGWVIFPWEKQPTMHPPHISSNHRHGPHETHELFSAIPPQYE